MRVRDLTIVLACGALGLAGCGGKVARSETTTRVAADGAGPSCAGGAFDATRVVVSDLATFPPQPARPSAPQAKTIVRSRTLTSGPPSWGR